MKKHIAVIISTCNRPFLLKKLVNQLERQLEKDDAIIIVNDGNLGSVSQFASEDIYTIDHCKDYYALASGRNKGIETAIDLGYEWGLLLDDDIKVSDRLIEKHKSAWSDKDTAYTGKITESGETEDARKKWWNGEGDFVIKWGGSNMSCHLPSLLEVGGYDKSFDGSWGYEDNELYQRLTSKHDWNVEYLEGAVITNLKAPTDKHYTRGDTTNRIYIDNQATYSEFEETEYKTISIGDKDLKLLYETPSEKKRIETLRGEEDFIKEIGGFIRKGDVVWDVGACIGIHTIYMAYHAREVHAFEPALLNFKHLNHNTTINDLDNVKTYKVALGEGEYVSRLKGFTEEAGEGRHALGNEGYEVVVKLGDAIKADRPNIVKIDVEGAEYEVLQGMEQIFSSGVCRGVFIEVHKGQMENFDGSPSEIHNFLEDRGYNLQKIEDKQNRYFIKGEL